LTGDWENHPEEKIQFEKANIAPNLLNTKSCVGTNEAESVSEFDTIPDSEYVAVNMDLFKSSKSVTA